MRRAARHAKKENKKASSLHCQASAAMIFMVVNALMKEEPIPRPLRYRQWAGEIASMLYDEPDEVFYPLDDLRNAIAGAGARVEKDGNELAALQNSLICMHDAVKAYEEHGFEVPKRLLTIQKRLEQRRDELDPPSQRPHL